MGEPVRGRGSCMPNLAPTGLSEWTWAIFPTSGTVPYTKGQTFLNSHFYLPMVKSMISNSLILNQIFNAKVRSQDT